MDRLSKERRIRSCKVDELEDAQVRGRLFEREATPWSFFVDDDDLAGTDLSHEPRADDVKRSRLGGNDPVVAQRAEAQWPEAMGVAHADERALVHDRERECPVEGREHSREGVLKAEIVFDHGLCDGVGHEFGVRRGAEPISLGLKGVGVDEVPVVCQGEAIRSNMAEDGLGVLPVA